MKSAYISSATTRPPSRRVADGGADDRRFGDRRVEQPVVGQRFGQPAVDGEGAAPIAVLLTESDHRRVDRRSGGASLRTGRRGRCRPSSSATGLPSSVGDADLAVICCTRGFSSSGCRNSGVRSSNFSTRRLENITSPIGFRIHGNARAGLEVYGELEHLEDSVLDAARVESSAGFGEMPPWSSSLARKAGWSRPAASARSLPWSGSWKHRRASGR